MILLRGLAGEVTDCADCFMVLRVRTVAKRHMRSSMFTASLS